MSSDDVTGKAPARREKRRSLAERARRPKRTVKATEAIEYAEQVKQDEAAEAERARVLHARKIQVAEVARRVAEDRVAEQAAQNPALPPAVKRVYAALRDRAPGAEVITAATVADHAQQVTHWGELERQARREHALPHLVMVAEVGRALRSGDRNMISARVAFADAEWAVWLDGNDRILAVLAPARRYL